MLIEVTDSTSQQTVWLREAFATNSTGNKAATDPEEVEQGETPLPTPAPAVFSPPPSTELLLLPPDKEDQMLMLLVWMQ
ncbi:hypothetical protein H920_06302 [Fukomys damarensis]|uniref:Uncharacterized protein n=1 Tax=Fukomys damarensis TaxID=885580 RepID=A0A091DQ14_FUKDA|nr:hypothetical protein H920_06302 [Fukomys damarensis]